MCESRIESETHHRTNLAEPKPKCFRTDIDFVLALICDASPASGSLFNLIPKYSFSPIGCLIRLYLQGSPIKVDWSVFFFPPLSFLFFFFISQTLYQLPVIVANNEALLLAVRSAPPHHPFSFSAITDYL